MITWKKESHHKWKYQTLLYGKPSLQQIPVLWLVLSRSGFCSTDRFHGKVQSVYFCFGAKSANSKFATKTAKKKVWILSFFTLKLPEEAKKIEIFPKFQRWMEKTNIFKCRPPEVHFTIRNWVAFNKQLSNLACLSRTREYRPSVLFIRISLRSVHTVKTSGQHSPVQPSRSVSKRLLFYWHKNIVFSLPNNHILEGWNEDPPEVLQWCCQTI